MIKVEHQFGQGVFHLSDGKTETEKKYLGVRGTKERGVKEEEGGGTLIMRVEQQFRRVSSQSNGKMEQGKSTGEGSERNQVEKIKGEEGGTHIMESGTSVRTRRMLRLTKVEKRNLE